MSIILNWVSFIAALLTTIGLLVHQNWRWGIGLLAVQYLSVFWLVQTHWPISLAAVKLVTGWMACVILGLANMNADNTSDAEIYWSQGRLFRTFTAGIIVAATFALALRASIWLGLDLPLTWSSLLLIGMGLLQLGITVRPFRVIIGLLTALAGFEIIYAAVESSVLVAALLSMVTLGLALTGAYFMVVTQEEKP